MTGSVLVTATSVSLLCFGYLALGCMALAMFGHFRASFNRSPSSLQSHGLYWFGWLMMLICFGLNVQQFGWAYGSIFFVGILSCAGLLVILTASYQPKFMPHFMLALAALGCLALFV
ncbi:DUF3325 domain-containing protein [Shewanella waksmanii]|uniref:DUF3325 domain-containing protein n=1 Tax=Shewanella waksmanii TaxID=213783 RepID=UPI0037350702